MAEHLAKTDRLTARIAQEQAARAEDDPRVVELSSQVQASHIDSAVADQKAAGEQQRAARAEAEADRLRQERAESEAHRPRRRRQPSCKGEVEALRAERTAQHQPNLLAKARRSEATPLTDGINGRRLLPLLRNSGRIWRKYPSPAIAFGWRA